MQPDNTELHSIDDIYQNHGLHGMQPLQNIFYRLCSRRFAYAGQFKH